MLELRNCTLPTYESVTIRIVKGTIAYVGPESGWENYLDLAGLSVLPGIIDMHVHDRTPGNPDVENPESLEQACIWGGITYTARMPNTNPPLTYAEQVDEKWRQLGTTGDSTKAWFGATSSNEKEIRRVAKDSRICGLKMYMGSSTGDLLVADKSDQYRIGEISAEENVRLAVHAEDEEMMRQNRRLITGQPLLSDHCIIRDTAVEVSAVERAAEIALNTGCQMHLCHISTPESLRIIRTAKDRGARLTVEVCPRHLFLHHRLTEGAVYKYPGYLKVNPPLRSFQQMGELRQLIKQPDMVDSIATDHAPHDRSVKQGNTYDGVPSGMPEVQTSLPLMMTLVQRGELSLARLVELMSANPAQLLGLPLKGRIAVGLDADLVCCSLKEETIDEANMKYKCGWTPYHGHSVFGVPQLVIKAGKIVLDLRQPT